MRSYLFKFRKRYYEVFFVWPLRLWALDLPAKMLNERMWRIGPLRISVEL